MIAAFQRALFSTAFRRTQCKCVRTLQLAGFSFARSMASSTITVLENINKSLELISAADKKRGEVRPLVIIYSWLMAKRNHVMKYGDIYIGQGFDVLTVNVSTTQLLWPATGSQVLANDVLDFLLAREYYRRVVIHAFSVGAYMFSEVMIKMQQEKKYTQVADRIAGQIYDSASDYTHVASGTSRAVTQNPLLRLAIEGYMRFHMMAFYQSSTQHFIRGSKQFHNTFIKCPALFLFSRDDAVDNAEVILTVIKEWKDLGVNVSSRCWDSSPHVSHMYRHPEEYRNEMFGFLKQIGLLSVPVDVTSTL